MGVICLTLLLCLRRLRSVVLFPNGGSLNREPPLIAVFLRKFVWLVCIASNAIVVIHTTLCQYLLEILTLQLKSGRKNSSQWHSSRHSIFLIPASQRDSHFHQDRILNQNRVYHSSFAGNYGEHCYSQVIRARMDRG